MNWYLAGEIGFGIWLIAICLDRITGKLDSIYRELQEINVGLEADRRD